MTYKLFYEIKIFLKLAEIIELIKCKQKILITFHYGLQLIR
jgi:hypothetical protein